MEVSWKILIFEFTRIYFYPPLAELSPRLVSAHDTKPKRYMVYFFIADRWSMLTIVKSKFENRDRRKTIRQTWGGIKYLDGVRLETIFLLGATVNEDQQREIVKENQLFGDLLQVDMTDSYK